MLWAMAPLDRSWVGLRGIKAAMCTVSLRRVEYFMPLSRFRLKL